MTLFLIWLSLLLSSPESLQINYPHNFIQVDHLGDLYAVNDSEIAKFNSKGEKISTFSKSMFGAITQIDVSDPLRILIFYRDFNQVQFLNRELSEIGNEIDLFQFSDNETELICSSQKGGFWIFNSTDNQAIHISSKGKKINQSILLSSFFDDTLPSKMIEYDTELYLLFPFKGILNLDQNGQFVKKIQIPAIEDFQISQNSIFYFKTGNLFEFKSSEKEDRKIAQSSSEKNQIILIQGHNLFISNKKSIIIKQMAY